MLRFKPISEDIKILSKELDDLGGHTRNRAGQLTAILQIRNTNKSNHGVYSCQIIPDLNKHQITLKQKLSNTSQEISEIYDIQHIFEESQSYQDIQELLFSPRDKSSAIS